MNKLPIVIHHSDLDGVVSYLTLCWAFGSLKLESIPTTPSKLEITLDTRFNSINLDEQKVIFADLDVSKFKDRIDQKGVYIFDHHLPIVGDYSFTKAVCVSDPSFTSCSKLIAKTLNLKNKINQKQLYLIALADDFDSNKKAFSQSYDLNIVFHNTNNKIKSFIDTYFDGFVPFDKFKLNIIRKYKKQLEEYLSNCRFYQGNFCLNDDLITIGVAVCDDYVSEVAEYILTKTDVSVALIIMPTLQRFILRKRVEDKKIDLIRFARDISKNDEKNIGGHESAVGGKLTEDLLTFISSLVV